MAELQFSHEVSRAEALLRAADALLRSFGPSEVALILPVAAVQDKGDLGLGTPAVEQVLLSPAVLRTLSSTGAARTRMELLLSAAAINAQAESRMFEPPNALLDAALGVQYGGKLLRIESVGWDSFAGVPYLYRAILTD